MLKATTSNVGAVNYAGTWDASTNTPTLASGVGARGQYYVVSVAGSTNLDGETNWQPSDWAVFNGSTWQKVDGGSTGLLTTLTVTGNTTLGDASTDTVQVNGYMGVGGAPYNGTAVQIVPTALVGVNQFGLASAPVATSAATSLVVALNGQVQTSAAAFTVANAMSVRLADANKGAGSTITNQHALYIADQTQGTNNYGITSLVSSGANKWNIYASGTAANYFAGKALVGTTTDQDGRLIIRSTGNTYANSAVAIVDSANTTKLQMLQTTSGVFYMTVNGTDDFVLKTTETVFNESGADIDFRVESDTNTHALFVEGSSGNVGIGVTPSAWASGWRAIQTLGGNSFYTDSTVSGLVSNAIYDGAWKYVNTAPAGIFQTDRNSHKWFSAPSGTAGNTITFTNTMTLDASGNLGIGTSSPDAKLRVNGTAKIGEGAASNTSKLMVNTVSGVAAGIQLLQDANESWIIQNPASTTALTFANSGTERMRITSGGNVGIGTSSPGDKLTIAAGRIRLDQDYQIVWQNAGTNRARIYGDAGNNLIFENGSSNTERARIPSAGGMVVGTAALATNATDGFLYVPTCAGTPTGTPTTQTGTAPIVIDTTNNKLYFYSGGQWRDAGP